MEQDELSEERIADLVHRFYAKVRADGSLAPIFDRVIGDRWDAHLAKMCAFWSSVMRTPGRYHGNPMVAHMRLKSARPEHFVRWLQLFRETASEICPPDEASAFIAKAENIAKSLQLGMFYRPNVQPKQPQGNSAL
jgi:hemoglobin